jgi:hypothetical protein
MKIKIPSTINAEGTMADVVVAADALALAVAISPKTLNNVCLVILLNFPYQKDIYRNNTLKYFIIYIQFFVDFTIFNSSIIIFIK